MPTDFGRAIYPMRRNKKKRTENESNLFGSLSKKVLGTRKKFLQSIRIKFLSPFLKNCLKVPILPATVKNAVQEVLGDVDEEKKEMEMNEETCQPGSSSSHL